ncbi:hypothetical protein MTR_4g009780 [Medicago truncatula]|uniref:Uncharacterized protein n=1 Tax=Medicago truncatula TaxID=3880 RepID=G7JGU5_MEDTR|nr:hypothetical protein MTR_4g009780 [Medicago truncatula]
MSLANYNPFCIAKTLATSESSNEKTFQQLAPTTTPSLSLTTTPIPHLPPSIGPVASTFSLYQPLIRGVQ